MLKTYFATIGILLTFCGTSVGTIPGFDRKNLDKDASDYINWVDFLHKNRGYHNHKEPQDMYKNGCQWGAWVTFPNKIIAIELKVGCWKTPEELFRSQDFIAMYKHPGYYWKHVLNYLSDPNHTEKQKKISIYGLEHLAYDLYLSFAKSCYQLYKQKLLSEDLLQMVLSFEFLRIHPLVTAVRYKDKKAINESFLREVQAYIGLTTPVGVQIEKLLSGKLVEEWDKKEQSAYIGYQNLLPLSEIITDAQKDVISYMKSWDHCPRASKPPYFLMIYDHSDYYYMTGIELYHTDIEAFLIDASHTNMEKRLAIFAMQKLSEGSYCQLIDSVCGLYHWDQVSVHVMEDLLHCSFPHFCTYPFFILDYRSAQHTLDRFISIPTLPCGLKEMAKKIKDGTLATPEEMSYIEGYRKFCRTHFTLYETIPRLEDRS